jgi:predicted anti-sigma-YlaC factor YlaD
MTDHLTETEVSLFRERTMMPTERERVDAHVAECESCLRRILPSEDSALVYSELTEALLPRDADAAFHLSHADLRRYANGVVDQADTVIFESHLEICDQCSEAMHSLPASPLVETVSGSTRQAEIPAEQFSPAWRSAFQFTPARAVAGVMVAACLVLAFVVWLRWPGGPADQTTQKTTGQTPSNTSGGSSPEPTQTQATKDPATDQLAVVASLEDNGRKIQLDSKGTLVGLEELPEASRSLVRGVLTNKTLSKPDILDKLTAPAITLMDPTARENTFGLLGPTGTVIATDRPNLRWQALPGATSYTVSVFDADFNRVILARENPNSPVTTRLLRTVQEWRKR